MNKIKKKFSLFVICTLILSIFQIPAVAYAAEEREEYTIYPTPQEITYVDITTTVTNDVNIVVEDDVDSYTLAKLESILPLFGVGTHSVSNAVVEGKTNFLLGVYNSGGVVDTYFETQSLIDDVTLFEKTDSHIVSVDDNVIAVLGVHTDATFYGLSSLKFIGQQSGSTITNLKINDYSDIAYRGFIEGYYGNPWSNEDRAELMRFGGEIKMNHYIFAPKDDPYHNSQWRDLYPEEELAEIAKLAEAGNASKNYYVWSIHPFMHSAFDFSNYENDFNIMTAKFQQLLDSGVRQFGVLADDAGGASVENTDKLLDDLTIWLTSKQADYPGLKTEIIYCPAEYYYQPSSITQYKILADNISFMTTGGKIWGEVSKTFGDAHVAALDRAAHIWLNWPCTDNSKQHLIMGGYTDFLHMDITPGTYQGITQNPMQQSEPSKIALFGNAEFSWNNWTTQAEADKAWDDAFAFVDHGNLAETDASIALRELSKHMINQNMDSRVRVLQESVELAPKLDSFLEKLELGTATIEEANVLKLEFQLLYDAAMTYETSAGMDRTYEQIKYWINSAKDTTSAIIKLLDGYIAYLNNDSNALWNNFSEAQALLEQAKTYTFLYVNETVYAEFGVQHIVPFANTLLSDLGMKVAEEIDPTIISQKFITSRDDNPSGNISTVLDGSDSTGVTYQTPNSYPVDEYFGVTFNKVIPVQTIEMVLGTSSNPRDTFTEAVVEYTVDGTSWHTLLAYNDTRSHIEITDLDIEALSIRVRATEPRDNVWLGVREININNMNEVVIEQEAEEIPYSVYRTNWNVYSGNDEALIDGNDSTFVWYNPKNVTGGDFSAVGDYIGLDAGDVYNVGEVRFVVGADGGDKWRKYHFEYSVDGVNWTEGESYTGNSSGKDVIVIDLEGTPARYVRLVNDEQVNAWIKFSEMSMENADAKITKYTYTNVEELEKAANTFSDALTTLVDLENVTLLENEYIGVKLDRLKDLKEIKVEVNNSPLADSALEVQYSANAIEWKTDLSSLEDARYVRLINTSSDALTFNLTKFEVHSNEIGNNRFVSTDLSISGYYGDADARNKGTTLDIFDGDLTTGAEFTDTPLADETIVYELGSVREISKLRLSNVDGERNYIRDAKVQVSLDGTVWTDVITIGDGIENTFNDSQATDGWIHDSVNPGNYYVEGTLTTPVDAKFVRVLFTANYAHRFVKINELIINDGEAVREINDPTIKTGKPEETGKEAYAMIDPLLTTAYKVDSGAGEILYTLTENTNVTFISFVQGSESNATIKARVSETEWITLGTLDEGITNFYNYEYPHIFQIKIEYTDGISVYQMLTRNNDELLGDLDALISYIASLDFESWMYTEDSYLAYTTALEEAQAVVDAPVNASAAKVDTAHKKIKDAVNMLVVDEVAVLNAYKEEAIKSLSAYLDTNVYDKEETIAIYMILSDAERVIKNATDKKMVDDIETQTMSDLDDVLTSEEKYEIVKVEQEKLLAELALVIDRHDYTMSSYNDYMLIYDYAQSIAGDRWVTVEEVEQTLQDLVEAKNKLQALVLQEGTKPSFTLGEKVILSTNIDFSAFIGVQINGVDLTTDQYTATEGSIIIELAPAFVDILGEGTHSISIITEEGNVNAQFVLTPKQVVKPEEPNTPVSPDTGDTTNAMAYLLFLLGAMIIARKVVASK